MGKTPEGAESVDYHVVRQTAILAIASLTNHAVQKSLPKPVSASHQQAHFFFFLPPFFFVPFFFLVTFFSGGTTVTLTNCPCLTF